MNVLYDIERGVGAGAAAGCLVVGCCANSIMYNKVDEAIEREGQSADMTSQQLGHSVLLHLFRTLSLHLCRPHQPHSLSPQLAFVKSSCSCPLIWYAPTVPFYTSVSHLSLLPLSTMTALTPRINGAYLNHHLNQTVRLVGRIHSMDASSGALQLVTSDNKLVSVFSAALQAGEGAFDPNVYRQGGTVEVVGQLKQEDGSVQEYTAISLGDSFGQPHLNTTQHHTTAHHTSSAARLCC